MVKRGFNKEVEEIVQVISKIKAILAGDDGSSPKFTSELQAMEKKFSNRLHHILELSMGKARTQKEVTHER